MRIRAHGQGGAIRRRPEKVTNSSPAFNQPDTLSEQVDRNVDEVERLSKSGAQSVALRIPYHEVTTYDFMEKVYTVVKLLPQRPSTIRMTNIAECFNELKRADSLLAVP